jgi:putative N-acetylmannosamine-6-phosphate epimerase
MSRRPRLPFDEVEQSLRGRLVVSCQPVEGGPLDDDDVVLRMARAAVAGGAAGLRIEGARRMAHVRRGIDVPLIGIVKRDLPFSAVRITPLLEDVRALADAGADIIAVDATRRARPAPLPSLAALLAQIRTAGAWPMADASCVDDALAAWALGFPIVATTLSGYTEGKAPEDPDLGLVAHLVAQGCRVMAEGRYDTPARAAAAVAAGAWSVTVGSALTRLELATARFADEIAASAPPQR